MARLITERIAELRKEIAEIQSASRLASISIPYQDRGTAEATKQRREERLKEIMKKLRSLTIWKKPRLISYDPTLAPSRALTHARARRGPS